MTDRIYFKDIIQGKSGISDARTTFVEGEFQEDKVVDNGVFIKVSDEVRFYPDSSYFYYAAEDKKEVLPVEEKAEEKGEVAEEEVEEAIVDKKDIETAELPKEAEEEFDDEEEAEKKEDVDDEVDKIGEVPKVPTEKKEEE